MSARADPHPIRDFFIADLIDYAPKDSAEMMERPFFSIAKRKRNKPIHYETPDGKLWIKVNGNPTHGMATIWDADILIWCISRIVAQRDAGKNDLRPTIHTTPYELLKGIARGTSGQDYIELLRFPLPWRHRGGRGGDRRPRTAQEPDVARPGLAAGRHHEREHSDARQGVFPSHRRH